MIGQREQVKEKLWNIFFKEDYNNSQSVYERIEKDLNIPRPSIRRIVNEIKKEWLK